MDWTRLGKFFSAWSQAIDGKHSVYVEDRAGKWHLYFTVSRSKGLMLADKSIQERMSGDEFENCGDPQEAGRKLAAKMRAAFDE